jgi:hypothetical protein
MSSPLRVLVATGHTRCPVTALRLASALAGKRGEVVLVAILVVPLAQRLDASLASAVARACEVLEQGERELAGAHLRDTRLVRARSLSDGLLETLASERFDLAMIERLREGGHGDREALAQLATVLERAPVAVAVVRPFQK